MYLRGIRAFAAVSGADMTIGVMCTLRGAQVTETVGTHLDEQIKILGMPAD